MAVADLCLTAVELVNTKTGRSHGFAPVLFRAWWPSQSGRAQVLKVRGARTRFDVRSLQELQTRSTRACWSEHPPSPPFATRQCGSRPLLHHARLCGSDWDKAMTRLRLPWHHKSSLPDSQPSSFPPLPLKYETCGNCSAGHCRARIGRGHSNTED